MFYPFVLLFTLFHFIIVLKCFVQCLQKKLKKRKKNTAARDLCRFWGIILFNLFIFFFFWDIKFDLI